MLGQKLRDLAVLPSKPPNGFTPEARMSVEGIERDAFDQTRRRLWRCQTSSVSPSAAASQSRGQHQHGNGSRVFFVAWTTASKQPLGNAELSVGSHRGLAKVAGADGAISP